MVPKRPLYAIGDVHGDADRLVKILTAHKLVDVSAGKVRFVKSGVVVVLMGDVLDARSRHGELGDMVFQNTLSDLWILEFLRVAANEARAIGSDVVAVLGNHELMNLRGDLQYASPHHMSTPAARREYFATGGGRNAITELFNTSIVYNGNHFSHAGIPLQATDVQKRMLGKRATPALQQLASHPELENLVAHRDYMKPVSPRSDHAFLASTVCRRHNVRRMVIGHNYTDGRGVVTSYDGRVVYTDVGISRAFTPSESAHALEIVYDDGSGDLVVLKADGTTAEIPERTV